MVKELKIIAIGKDKDSYQLPLNLNRLSRYLQYIIPNSNRELKNLYKMLDLDSASRRRNRNTINYQTDANERRTLNNINKGLTMELFASGMISYFDHPLEVHANCSATRSEIPGAISGKPYNVVPHNFAQRGMPDVVVDYGNFSVILEVSAKSKPSLEDFKKQMKGALEHARAIRENGYEKPVYCVLINERSLEQSEIKITMKAFLESITPSEQIYLAVVSIQEFAKLGQVMVKQYEADVANIQSNDLLSALQATVDKGIQGQFDQLFLKQLEAVKSPSDSDWF